MAVCDGDSIGEAPGRVVIGGDAGGLLEHTVAEIGELLGSLDDARDGAVAGLIEESGDGAVDHGILEVIDGGVAEECEYQGAVSSDREFRVVFVRTANDSADLFIQGGGDAEVVEVRDSAELGEVFCFGGIGEVSHLPWARLIRARSPSKAKEHLKGVPAPKNRSSSMHRVVTGVNFDSTAQVLAV